MTPKQSRKELRKALPKMRVSRVHDLIAPEGVIQQQRVDHAVAHTARILENLKKDTLSAESRANLENALEDYKDLIHQAGAASFADAHELLQIRTPADLNHDQLKAAVAHLEG